jgi:hypothetical protein
MNPDIIHALEIAAIVVTCPRGIPKAASLGIDPINRNLQMLEGPQALQQ